jgi:Raf kinase inhibitor-like YbhB/YbcL family protein
MTFYGAVSARTMSLFAAAALIAGAAGLRCADAAGAADAKAERLNVQSPDFSSGARIPAKFAKDGADVSPNLYWSKAPAQAKSIAVTCTDPDAPRGVWWHWIVFNLPPETTQLKENQSKAASLAGGACQGTNDFGKTGYNGPDPPGGAVHHYHFAVYALDCKLALRPGCGKVELSNALKGHVLASGEYVGTYERR